MSDFDQKKIVFGGEYGTEAEFGGIWSAISDVVSSAWDDIGDFISNVPGAKELAGAMGDFANTAAGQVVLRAFATSLTGGLAWTVGPQLATIAWAIPGLAKGDKDFVDAWTNEFKWRVETTAQIMGADVGKLVAQQIADALNQLHLERAISDPIKEGINQLADRLHIREDAAALVKSAWNGTNPPNMANFDPATGKQTGGPEIDIVTTANFNKRNPMLSAAAMQVDANQYVARKPNIGRIKKKTNPLGGAVGAAVGVGGAVALGATLPIALGVGAILGAFFYSSKK